MSRTDLLPEVKNSSANFSATLGVISAACFQFVDRAKTSIHPGLLFQMIIFLLKKELQYIEEWLTQAVPLLHKYLPIKFGVCIRFVHLINNGKICGSKFRFFTGKVCICLKEPKFLLVLIAELIPKEVLWHHRNAPVTIGIVLSPIANLCCLSGKLGAIR